MFSLTARQPALAGVLEDESSVNCLWALVPQQGRSGAAWINVKEPLVYTVPCRQQRNEKWGLQSVQKDGLSQLPCPECGRLHLVWLKWLESREVTLPFGLLKRFQNLGMSKYSCEVWCLRTRGERGNGKLSYSYKWVLGVLLRIFFIF